MAREIRRAGPGDAECVAGLVLTLAEEMGEAAALTAEYARRYLEAPGAGAFLALLDGEQAGTDASLLLERHFAAPEA
ncbi:MAG: hypothetical protein ACM3X6_05920 [Patescibacteria group bacterium]